MPPPPTQPRPPIDPACLVDHRCVELGGGVHPRIQQAVQAAGDGRGGGRGRGGGGSRDGGGEASRGMASQAASAHQPLRRSHDIARRHPRIDLSHGMRKPPAPAHSECAFSEVATSTPQSRRSGPAVCVWPKAPLTFLPSGSSRRSKRDSASRQAAFSGSTCSTGERAQILSTKDHQPAHGGRGAAQRVQGTHHQRLAATPAVGAQRRQHDHIGHSALAAAGGGCNKGEAAGSGRQPCVGLQRRRRLAKRSRVSCGSWATAKQPPPHPRFPPSSAHPPRPPTAVHQVGGRRPGRQLIPQNARQAQAPRLPGEEPGFVRAAAQVAAGQV